VASICVATPNIILIEGSFATIAKALWNSMPLKKPLGNQSCVVSINLTIRFSINLKHPFITYGNPSS
jgi:hypothetical protein